MRKVAVGFALLAMLFLFGCVSPNGSTATNGHLDSDVTWALRKIHSSDPRDRAIGAYQAGELGISSAIPALVRMLGDTKLYPDGDDGFGHESFGSPAEVATQALVKFDKAAISDLSMALRNSSSRVRKRAAWALTQIDDQATIEPIRRALQDRDEDVRLTTIMSISNESVGSLVAVISRMAAHDENDSIREWAGSRLSVYRLK